MGSERDLRVHHLGRLCDLPARPRDLRWKEKRAAIITAFGFAAILFTLYAVNLWIAGLHSYARA